MIALLPVATATGVCKKKTKLLRNVRDIFAKFSRSFEKFSEVFGSFRRFSEVFGRARMRLDVFERFLAEKTPENRNEKFGTKTCIFAMFLRSRVKTKLVAPHPTDRKNKQKNKVCLK